ncbi:MAG: ATP-binding protein [Egibacteraceae bacterium]
MPSKSGAAHAATAWRLPPGLLMGERDDRARRRSERRVEAAAFPREKPLRTSDFDIDPNVDPAVSHTLATRAWVRKGLPLRLISDSARDRQVPPAHRSGTEAATAGFRVRDTPATKLVNELVVAADDMVRTKTIARYGRGDLLCIDELGCMELDRRGAELLFQALTEREEKASVAIASNESFAGWTKTFTGHVSAPPSSTASPSAPTPTAEHARTNRDRLGTARRDPTARRRFSPRSRTSLCRAGWTVTRIWPLSRHPPAPPPPPAALAPAVDRLARLPPSSRLWPRHRPHPHAA